MTVPGTVTAAEFDQARRIEWAPSYWLNLLNHFWTRNSLVFFGTILISSIAWTALLPRHPIAVGILISLTSICVFTPLIRGVHRPQASFIAKINKDMPRSIEIEPSGVRITDNIGILSIIPWTAFREWRCSELVAILYLVGSNNLALVPLSTLSPSER